MLRLIDSHAHVQFPVYDSDRDAVIARALGEGVGMVNVGTQYSTSLNAADLAERYPDGVWATAGFHPNHLDANAYHDRQELKDPNEERFDYAKFFDLARHPKVVAIGECGLDYYRADSGRGMADSVKERQQDIFRQQIELAHELKKPLVIHCRQAFPDLISILSANRYPLTSHGNGVVHFFSGSWEDAERLLDLGFFLGFGGVITFARDYDEVITKAPLGRIVVETDAPYVSPVPYRGKRNEPAYVVETAKKIAELRGVAFEDVAAATTANVKDAFRI